MQPVQLGPDAYPGLVGVSNGGGDERVADGLLQGLEPHARDLDRAVHAARRERNAADRRQQLGGALIGQQLVLGEVDRQRRDTRTVLHRGGHALGKVAAVRPTTGAGTGDGAVFDHLAPDLQLDDLSPLGPGFGGDLRTGATACTDTAQRYDDVLLGIFDQRERGARVALLPARLAPGRLALRAWRWLRERRIRRRRLVGVVAVLVQAGLELGYALAQLLDQRQQLGVLRPQPLDFRLRGIRIGRCISVLTHNASLRA